MRLLSKIFLVATILFFNTIAFADIPSDIKSGISLDRVIANAKAAGKNPDEIVRLLIENKVDPGEATTATINAYPGFIHATSITRAAISAAPFSAASITGAAVTAASSDKKAIKTVALKSAPKQAKAIRKSVDDAQPPYKKLDALHEGFKKEKEKSRRQLKSDAEEGLAGFIIASRGAVTATDKEGKVRELTRRSKFYSTEVIKTGPGSSAQLRFEDRAVMGLRENSVLNISQYRYAGKGDNENKAVMELVAGGFRTISGSIGKSDRSAYKVDTPTATIGIRGTDYEVIIDVGGGVVAAVWSGGITVTNNFGSLDIGSNSTHIFATIVADIEPQGTEEIPQEFLINNDGATALSAEQVEVLAEVLGEEVVEELEEFLKELEDEEGKDEDDDGDDDGDDEGDDEGEEGEEEGDDEGDDDDQGDDDDFDDTPDIPDEVPTDSPE